MTHFGLSPFQIFTAFPGHQLNELFNTKSLYIYIKYAICKYVLLITFLNKPMLIILQTVKWLQVLLHTINNSINQSFVYTQLNNQTVLFQTIQY